MNIKNKIITVTALVVGSSTMLFAEGVASGAASGVASAVDLSDVAVGAAAIGGSLAGAYVAIKGIKIVLGMLKGG